MNIFSVSIKCPRHKHSFDGIENKYDVYRGEAEHAINIINFKKKKMIPLTNEEYESYINQINCHICKKVRT